MNKQALIQRIAVALAVAAVMFSTSVLTVLAWQYAYLDEYPPDWVQGRIDKVDYSTGWGGSAKWDIAGDYTAWGHWLIPFGGTGHGHWWVWIPLNYGPLDAWVYYQKNPGSAPGGHSEWVLVAQEYHANEWVDLGWLEPQKADAWLGLNAADCVACLDWPQVWWDEAYLAWAQH